jgi:hypothetical protein
MTITDILKALLIAALLVSIGARAADTAIQIDRDQGTPVAQFKVGDSHCVLKDDKIRCEPVRK